MEDTSSEESGEGNETSEQDKKYKNDGSCKSKKTVKRKLKTFSFSKWQKGFNKEKNKKRTFCLNRDAWQSCSSVVSESSLENATCICTGYRKTKNSSSDRRASHDEAGPSKEIAVCKKDTVGGSILAIATCTRSVSPNNSEELDERRRNNQQVCILSYVLANFMLAI